MHMMDIFVEDKELRIVEKDYIAYIKGKNNSIYARNEPVVEQAYEGKFDEVKSKIIEGNNGDFANPFLLHSILDSAIYTKKANKEEKIQFIKYLLTLEPLVKLIKEVPYKVYGRITNGDCFIQHESAIGTAVRSGEREIIQIFNELDDGETVRKSDGLKVAAIEGLVDEAALILSTYKVFTQKEIKILNEVDEMIKQRKLNASNIDTMVHKLIELNLLDKTRDITSLPKSMEEDVARRIKPTANESKYAHFLQELIFKGEFQEVKDYINRNDGTEESQSFRSPYALELILGTILQNKIKTEEQEGIDFIRFLLSFESVTLAVKSNPHFISKVATRNCLEVMRLFIALDNGESVSKTDVANIAFTNGCVAHEYVQMFELLISNPKIAEKADIDRIKSTIKFRTDYNRTEHLEGVLSLLNSKKLELSKPRSTFLPLMSIMVGTGLVTAGTYLLNQRLTCKL